MPDPQVVRAQTQAILASDAEVAVFPPGSEETGEVQFLYRRRTCLTRDVHADAVDSALRAVLPDGSDVSREGLGREWRLPGLTRMWWSGDADRDAGTVDVMDALDARLGPGVARLDHLLYVCPHSCAFIEPEEVPAGTARPMPAVQTGQDARHPGCGHGEGARVVIFDTGFLSSAVATNPWLHGVTGDEEPLPADGSITADQGHGTFVAGCLRAAAPGAAAHVIRTATLDRGIGGAFESELAGRLVTDLAGAAADIVVFSFAGNSRNELPMIAFEVAYETSLRYRKDLVIVAPAGNDGVAQPFWPGAFPWVLSVGALAENWRDRASYSNSGPTVDVYAPGSRIVNAYATGDYVCAWPPNVGQRRRFDGSAIWSGTSFSAPLVAGLLASRMSTTGQNSRRALHSLLEIADGQAVPGVGAVLLPGQGCCGSACGCGCGHGHC